MPASARQFWMSGSAAACAMAILDAPQSECASSPCKPLSPIFAPGASKKVACCAGSSIIEPAPPAMSAANCVTPPGPRDDTAAWFSTDCRASAFASSVTGRSGAITSAAFG
jgi:hypothetical protein